MAYRSRESKVLAKAEIRSAGLTSIQKDGQLDLGNNFTHSGLTAKMTELHDELAVYNEMLKTASGQGNKLQRLERELNAYMSGVLTGVRQKYGPDSDAYEKAGGVRQSERAKPKPRANNQSQKSA